MGITLKSIKNCVVLHFGKTIIRIHMGKTMMLAIENTSEGVMNVCYLYDFNLLFLQLVTSSKYKYKKIDLMKLKHEILNIDCLTENYE